MNKNVQALLFKTMFHFSLITVTQAFTCGTALHNQHVYDDTGSGNLIINESCKKNFHYIKKYNNIASNTPIGHNENTITNLVCFASVWPPSLQSNMFLHVCS